MEIKLDKVKKRGVYEIQAYIGSEVHTQRKEVLLIIQAYSPLLFKKKGAHIGKYNPETKRWDVKTRYHINQFSDDVREKMAILDLVAASSEVHWVKLPDVGSTTKAHAWYRIVLKGGNDE